MEKFKSVLIIVSGDREKGSPISICADNIEGSHKITVCDEGVESEDYTRDKFWERVRERVDPVLDELESLDAD